MTLEPPATNSETLQPPVAIHQAAAAPPGGYMMRTRAELQKRPLPLEIFRRVQRAILRLVAARYSAHWGARRAQLNRITLLDMIRVLLGHGRFVLGERVAFTVAGLAKVLGCSERTVRRAIARLSERPELVRVLHVTPGELAYDGITSGRLHLEYELGEELRAVVADFIETPLDAVDATLAPPDKVSPDNLSPDLAPPSTNELKDSTAQHPATDRLNLELSTSGFSSQIPPDTDRHDHPQLPPDNVIPEAASPLTPPRRAAAVARERSARAPAFGQLRSRPVPEASATFSQPIPLLDAVIRQHRDIAEGKGPYVPINDQERALVDGALSLHRGSCRSEEELLALCAQVSERALRASRSPTATLRFAFGGPDSDNPNKFFHARVSELREAEERTARQQLDSALTSTLLGRPFPGLAKAKPPAPRRWRGPSRAAAAPSPASSVPLSPQETLAAIAGVMARLNGPSGQSARTG